MLEQRPLTADAANTTRLRRRHLADECLIERLVAIGHAFDVEERFVARRAHVAGVFAERTFMLGSIGRNLAFEDDFGGGGHFQRHGFTGHQIDRRTAQRAGDGKFIERVGHFRNRNIADGWISADDDRHRSRLVLRIVLIHVPRHVLALAD